MKEFFEAIFIVLILVAIFSPYYSLLNLDGLRDIKKIHEAIDNQTKAIHGLNSSVIRLLEEIRWLRMDLKDKKTGRE